MALLAQPGEQRLAAECTVAVDADPHPFGQQRQGLSQQRLLIGQAALATMVQREPGQWKRATAKADAHDQDVMRIAQQHAIDQQLHPLALRPCKAAGQRLIVLGLGQALVIQQAPDALLFGGWVVSKGIERAILPIWAETLWPIATTTRARVRLAARAAVRWVVSDWRVVSQG
ncbi:MAG: hypothetical protein IPO81_15745 [Kouleothrix sp.]|nr:hypothetical protein [Kouleothrix sp.]